MTDFPTNISVELEDDDVRKSLFQTLTAMDLIRNEAITSQLNEEKKDEYLHLTYRLASNLKGLANETVIEKMNFVVNELSKNGKLMDYDITQRPYWLKTNKDFCETLDDLVFNITQDLFLTTRHKYHILQGIKYLAVLEADKEERKKVFSTILPHQHPVSIDQKQTFSQRVLGLFFGNTYRIQDVDGGGIRIHGSFSDLEPIIEMCNERGYDFIEFELYGNCFREFKKVLRENYNLEAQAKQELDVNKILVKIDIGKPNKATKPKNYFEVFREVAQKDLQGRESLVWQEDKHFKFGRKFEMELKKELKNQKIDTNILTDYEFVAISDIFKNDDTTKITATYFGAEQDITLSLVTEENVDYVKLTQKNLPKVLNSNKSIEDKMKEIHSLTKAKYLRCVTSLGETVFEDRTLLV